ncbi:phosphoglycolate phosphatase [Fulvimarina pelagi HTCC2506]|uniref:Phosphoglycolate phosphatase n=1 Tax=Fulvimarina pelagi HTCC2506 TaxID=314231 RepID=Q0G5U7_9HYPH|nr:phosphoglycolate phosphatase [Fulvimarina pelagi]EAU42967.1 phosphoglycolate phosphatase [Fulvimarina pelagi HTCC2506]
MTQADGWPKAVLFDLDGTLVDSAPDIREALNEAMAERSVAPFELSEVRTMVGGGVALLVERALARREHVLAERERAALVERFVALYEPRATRLTTLLPGAAEALQASRAHGAKTALVTNKPKAPALSILEHFAIARHFNLVVGGDAGPAKKPAPDLLLHAARELEVEIANCLFVGDSENDVTAAKAAGMAVAALRGGYTTLSIESLDPTHRLDLLSQLSTLFR